MIHWIKFCFGITQQLLCVYNNFTSRYEKCYKIKYGSDSFAENVSGLKMSVFHPQIVFIKSTNNARLWLLEQENCYKQKEGWTDKDAMD